MSDKDDPLSHLKMPDSDRLTGAIDSFQVAFCEMMTAAAYAAIETNNQRPQTAEIYDLATHRGKHRASGPAKGLK